MSKSARDNRWVFPDPAKSAEAPKAPEPSEPTEPTERASWNPDHIGYIPDDYDLGIQDDEEDEGDYRYDNPFDAVLLTEAQAKELCTRVTGDKMDCYCRRGPLGYRIKWVWTEKDRKGKDRWLEYNIQVPRRRPMEVKVTACSSNYNLRVSTRARKQRNAELTAVVLRHLGDILGIDLEGYEPDTERAKFFPENR
jgi:hypothetical protein